MGTRGLGDMGTGERIRRSGEMTLETAICLRAFAVKKNRTRMTRMQRINADQFQGSKVPEFQSSNSPTVLQSYRPTVLPSYRPTVLQSYSPTVLQSYSATVLPSYRPTVPKSYSPTVLLHLSQQHHVVLPVLLRASRAGSVPHVLLFDLVIF